MFDELRLYINLENIFGNIESISYFCLAIKQKYEIIIIEHNVSIIHDIFIKVINAYIESEKVPIELPDGSLVYKSELHTVVEIGKSPGINVTELADRLSVTKGAISQVSRKLEKKALITRNKDFNNDKEIRLYLTTKGTILFEAHNDMIKQMSAEMESKLGNISHENYKFLQAFLNGILDHLRK